MWCHAKPKRIRCRLVCERSNKLLAPYRSNTQPTSETAGLHGFPGLEEKLSGHEMPGWGPVSWPYESGTPVLATLIAGWLNEQQQRAIEYLHEENCVLREQLGARRVLLNDYQRRRLAVRGKTLGRRLLGEVCTIVTPDTILRWHRRLIARKYDGNAKRRRGRPRVMRTIRELCVVMASENPGGVLADSGSPCQSWPPRRALHDPAYPQGSRA